MILFIVVVVIKFVKFIVLPFTSSVCTSHTSSDLVHYDP